MFRIFSKGWDGFVLMPAKRSRELQGGGLSGFLFIALAVLLAVLFGDVLALPIACILLAIGVSAAFGGKGNLFFLTPAALPVLAFGFVAACWELFRSTTVGGGGPIGIVGWLLMGVLGVLLCIRELEARPFSGAVLLIIVGILWFSPISSMFAGDEVFVVYAFIAVCAIAALLAAVGVIRFILRLFTGTIRFRSIFIGILLFILGLIPIAAVHYTSGVWASVWSPTIRVAGMLVLYLLLAIIGRAIAASGGHEPQFEMNYLLLPLTLVGAVFFLSRSALTGALPPIPGVEKVFGVFGGGFWSVVTAFSQSLLGALSDLFTVVSNFVAMMVLRLFGISVPFFRVPVLASFLLGVGLTYLFVRLGMGIQRRGRE